MIFLDLPWWASVIGAVAVYLVLGLLVPAMATGGIGGIVTAGVMRVLGPAMAGLILVAGALGALYRWVDRKAAERRSSAKS